MAGFKLVGHLSGKGFMASGKGVSFPPLAEPESEVLRASFVCATATSTAPGRFIEKVLAKRLPSLTFARSFTVAEGAGR